jgi:hypothetical protein
MTDIELIAALRKQAQDEAQSRRIAEFGPGGGNPDAKECDHIEWIAADRLVVLLDCIEDLEAQIEKV